MIKEYTKPFMYVLIKGSFWNHGNVMIIWPYFDLFLKHFPYSNRYRFLLQGQKISTHLLPNDVCATILKTQGTQFIDQYKIGATKVSLSCLPFNTFVKNYQSIRRYSTNYKFFQQISKRYQFQIFVARHNHFTTSIA